MTDEELKAYTFQVSVIGPHIVTRVADKDDKAVAYSITTAFMRTGFVIANDEPKAVAKYMQDSLEGMGFEIHAVPNALYYAFVSSTKADQIPELYREVSAKLSATIVSDCADSLRRVAMTGEFGKFVDKVMSEITKAKESTSQNPEPGI